MLVVELNGPTMFARIGVMQALNRGQVREFNRHGRVRTGAGESSRAINDRTGFSWLLSRVCFSPSPVSANALKVACCHDAQPALIFRPSSRQRVALHRRRNGRWSHFTDRHGASARRGRSEGYCLMTEKVQTTWYDVVRACGVTEKDAETIKGAFVYEGFSF